jgi:SAM-dependent methyltransferase
MRDRDLVERRFAEFYSLYADEFARDLPIYRDLACKYPGPVLEVGCGTGRVVARLAEAGHEVQGIDTSRPMLELAQARLHPWAERARVHDFDLRQQALPERFHLALVTLYAFNNLIDVEEQRLFLRHLHRSLTSSGLAALDLCYPLAFVRPEECGKWRLLEREVSGRKLVMRDRREMLTPLLERRTQVFSIDGGPETEYVTHRRYVPPALAASLLTEAGFEQVRWIRDYDLSTVQPLDAEAQPGGPFVLIAEI